MDYLSLGKMPFPKINPLDYMNKKTISKTLATLNLVEISTQQDRSNLSFKGDSGTLSSAAIRTTGIVTKRKISRKPKCSLSNLTPQAQALFPFVKKEFKEAGTPPSERDCMEYLKLVGMAPANGKGNTKAHNALVELESFGFLYRSGSQKARACVVYISLEEKLSDMIAEHGHSTVQKSLTSLKTSKR